MMGSEPRRNRAICRGKRQGEHMGAARSYRRLWQRCSRRVEELDLPSPFDAVEFIGNLARARGRDIDLVPVTARPPRADC